MANEPGVRDAKLIQYLNEAYGKEKQLEQALQAHIKMTDVAPYKKRLQQHLKETKGHARELQKRIKQLGGKAEAMDLPGPDAVVEAASGLANVAGKAVAAAQGAVQSVRGTSKQEMLLKNAKDEYHEEAEEIANYTAIQALAEAVGDTETAKLAKSIIKEEQRMAKYLEGLIPRLTKSVVTAEIPAKERRTSSSSSRRKSPSSTSRSTSRSSGSSTRAKSSGTSSRAKSTAASAKSTATRAKTTAGKAKSTAKSATKASSSRAKSSNGSSRSTAAKGSSTRRKASTTKK